MTHIISELSRGQNSFGKIRKWKSAKYGTAHTKTYFLSLVIRSANDVSHAYIFIILMPVMTSFMVLILASVKAAVLLLRGTDVTDEPQQRPPTFVHPS